jgi:hypothetical protein
MKRIVSFFVLLYVSAAIYAQGAQMITEATQMTTTQLDSMVRGVVTSVNNWLITVGAQKVSVGQFVFQDRIVPLSNYWNAQLTQELAALPNRKWILLSGPATDADYTISGEIVEIVNTVRVYTRLIRSSDRSIASSTLSDFNREPFIVDMLAGGSSSRGGSSSSSIVRDAYEPDSMALPLSVELASSDEGQLINRTIHISNDDDFFLLTPDKDGLMTCETTGSMDTYMELYEAQSGRKIVDNDDGGSGGNARIRQTVRAGSRYIAKVRGYSGETGSYGFRAYLIPEQRIERDEYEPDDTFADAKDITTGVPQQHTFHTGDDVDWVTFQITSAGNYTIRARGVNSNRLDTYIELFDSNRRSIDEDDDGGENMDSRVSRRFESGTYYLKVECLDSSPNQPYVISIEAE